MYDVTLVLSLVFLVLRFDSAVSPYLGLNPNPNLSVYSTLLVRESLGGPFLSLF
jgi:hypothetical protein